VAVHGARHLLLASRSGAAAEGAAELRADLEELGAEVQVAACDVADPEAARALLDSVSAEHPLGAVFHAAAALDDATIESLAPERFGPVFTPKADAAWALHELTRELDLTHFVLFSSAAGTLGGPGQGNYAAANAFCDALVQVRRAEGLPATSIAWGYWETTSALTGKLTDADLERMRRSGVAPLSDEQGLALLDRALVSPRADVLGIGVDTAGLRQMASAGMLPPLLSALIRTPKRRARTGPSLATKLAELPEAERAEYVLDLVRAETAAVLGHDSAAEVPPNRAFQELGFDSLAALELRNRLGGLSGARLEPTIVFDHPDPERLAAHLLVLTGPAAGDGGGGVDADLARLENSLGALPAEDPGRVRLAAHLRALAADLEGAGAPGERYVDREGLAQATDEELLEFIDEQVGGGAAGG
jgi:NAD(P)-dependent dehydrogenase (short-subunit alcohol dehydrogenase family)